MGRECVEVAIERAHVDLHVRDRLRAVDQHAGADLIGEADLIVPVPLHYMRLVRRGFNQSGWLAAAEAMTLE